MNTKSRSSHKPLRALATGVLVAGMTLSGTASADLIPAGIFNGNVGLSIDAVGSNSTPVGNIQAEIPVGASIVQAYLYAAGTPFPWYLNSPQNTADYNGAGISLSGTGITNFDTIVGATALPGRPDIGNWFTGRADVTQLIQDLVAADPLNASHSWSYVEGAALNNRIDGAVLAVVFDEPGLPEGSVVLLDGGQNTNGETTTVNRSSTSGGSW